MYAPYRFASDFLRVRDVRYLGLTPAQWGTLALLVLAVGILVAGRAGGPARRQAPRHPRPPRSDTPFRRRLASPRRRTL